MKSEKGITLVSLMVIVIVLLILAGVTIYSITRTPNIQNLNKMKTDLKELRDKVLIYYNKYKDLPVERRTRGNIKNKQAKWS